MTKELFGNEELILSRKETHKKNQQEKVIPVFTSRMEKREYYKNVHLFDIRNVLDINELLKDIRINWNTYVAQVNSFIQKNPVKKGIVTGIFTIILGFFASSSNAAIINEYTYQVTKGEKIENIAKDHGVTANEILEANGISSIDGKKILLPKVQDKMVTASVLNARSRPNTGSAIVAKYKKGDIVKVSFVENGWAGILIEGKVFYVSDDYLTQKSDYSTKEDTFNLNSKSFSNHVIKKGDTLTKIANAFGFSVKDIQDLNPTVNPTKLRIGQTIKIPVITATKTTNFETKTMYVTAFSLRVRESASMSSNVLGSLNLNDRVYVKSISNGWAQIQYKGKAAFVSESYLTDNNRMRKETFNKNNTPSSEYVIKRGDTFTKISKALGTTVSALQDLNPTVNSTKLKIGQKIKIPTTNNQIKVWAKIGGINPDGVFRFITSEGNTYAAQASGDLLNGLFELQGEKLMLTLEGKRGQKMTLMTLH